MSKMARQTRRRPATLLSVATICAIALPSSILLAASPSSAEEDKFANGKQVSRGSVAGDGATAQASGDVELIDGVGASWFLNTNITFSTTSSASGAASEMSFDPNPTAASTVDGGPIDMTLGDGFDGYNSLQTFVGAGATRAAALSYNELGADPTTECGGRELVYPAQVNGDVTVTREVYVPADAGYARWTNSVTNNSNTATTVTFYIDNNLGSDSNTTIFASSSGDAAADLSDRWVGTMQRFTSATPGTTSSDPRLGHVLQGNGAAATLIENTFVELDDNPEWAHQLTLAAGETRSILNYAVGRGTKAAVIQAASAIAAQAPDVCFTQDEANAVANFTGLGVAPTLTLPASFSTQATTASGANVSFTATAVDGNGKSVPVTCTPASGSLFPVGTTTVTCTATDAQGRKTTGTFKVTVTAAPTCDGEIITMQATPGVVTTGTSGKDVILGTTLADTINSLGGNDVICGVGGNDTINSGAGDDKVLGGDGDDKVVAGLDNDEVHGDAGDDIVRGGRGRDTVHAGDGDDLVVAGRDADKVTGDAGNDSLRGIGGNDRLKGNGGKDRVVGGTGNDTVSGGAGKDQLNGNRGDDKVTSGGGADQARGGPGQDVVDGVRG